MHGAVSIRPQDAHSRILQSFEELRAGMPVRIAFSRGYDSQEWLYCSEEFRRRRILTSVMADLQHIGMHCFRTVLGKNFALHLFFSISREEDASAAVAQAQHQRVIVLC